MLVREQLAAAVRAAVQQVRQKDGSGPQEVPAAQLHVPPSREQGDFSTDVALTLAREGRHTSLSLAEAIAAELRLPEGLVERVEVAGSGFLNFHLRPDWVYEGVREALRQRDAYGRVESERAGAPALVEFVSGQPTGPLTAMHGRGAAVGDALANLLEWSGCSVSREYYVNDTGSQLDRFGRSLDAEYRKACAAPNTAAPVDGFQGPYLTDLGARLCEEHGASLLELPADERIRRITAFGRDAVVSGHRETLDKLGIRFDAWLAEQSLLDSGALDGTIALLRERDAVYSADGAEWLRSTAFGDELDRPLIRSTGKPSYIAGDLAYHLDKFRRGFEILIDVWGPEHAGYAERTRAGIRALGCDADRLEILILGPVTARVAGMSVEAGASSGNNLLLDEVIDAIGPDAARLLYLSQPLANPLLIDLDETQRPGANPASTVLQALRNAEEWGGEGSSGPGEGLARLESDVERALLRRVADFPGELLTAARERDPYRLFRFALDTASGVEAFRILASAGTPDPDVAEGRRALARAAAVVLRNALAVLGIAAG